MSYFAPHPPNSSSRLGLTGSMGSKMVRMDSLCRCRSHIPIPLLTHRRPILHRLATIHNIYPHQCHCEATLDKLLVRHCFTPRIRTLKNDNWRTFNNAADDRQRSKQAPPPVLKHRRRKMVRDKSRGINRNTYPRPTGELSKGRQPTMIAFCSLLCGAVQTTFYLIASCSHECNIPQALQHALNVFFKMF